MRPSDEKIVEIIVEESLGIDRSGEPVTVGVPFPQGVLNDKKFLSLVGKDKGPLPLQSETLAVWPDKSIKWILLDFEADCPERSALSYYLRYDGPLLWVPTHNKQIRIAESGPCVTVDTGNALFVLDKQMFLPFRNVKLAGEDVLDVHKSRVILRDENQKEFFPIINNMEIETGGPLRSTIRVAGRFESGDNKAFSDFFARLSFYAGKGYVKVDFTIRNPKEAKHPGGLWDLGDEGSVYFKDLSFNLSAAEEKNISIFWKSDLNKAAKQAAGSSAEIYQNSSGGEHWDSPNHVNRFGIMANSFRGYKITEDDILLEDGHRASPSLTLTSGRKSITALIQKFWQNFPKAIKAENNTLTLKLFPGRHNDTFELQGGEQKTHTIYLRFDMDEGGPGNLEWAHGPLICRNAPEWYARSAAAGHMSPQRRAQNIEYSNLVDNAINGRDSFFNLREKIDEYGWRNFGDVYASHEIAFYKGKLFPFVSHYNNQYDIINGCFLQFAMTGDARWIQLMSDLACHVMDIDVYHTEEDRPGYNGGHFWHTDHFMHAETSTHRSYSKINMEINGMKSYGGGPSLEHCYTTGLTHYYYLTGNIIAKETVIGLAEWVMNADNMGKSFLGVLRKTKQKVSRMLNKYANAPGRGEANSINTLLDAFELSEDRKYLLKAESIIKQFISPSDNIEELNRQQIELRWFYLIFLQSVGRYIDVKDIRNEKDYMFNYAKDSLLYHARWMLRNEVPYKELFHIVEIPSSTWPAQDIRKSAILDYAYKYSDGDIKGAFREKAEYFYNSSINDVLSFKDGSATFVRPLAVLMHYGVMHTFFQDEYTEAVLTNAKN